MTHKAFYGNVGLVRRYCINCRGYAFVLNGEFSCCGKKANNSLLGIRKKKIMTSSRPIRKRPNAITRKLLFNLQENRCLYCGFNFDSIQFGKDNKPIFLHICYDHVEPFSYSHNNNNINFVMSCQICNSIKSNKMFNTIEEIQNHVEIRRKKKGYETIPKSELSLLRERVFSQEKMAEILFRGL